MAKPTPSPAPTAAPAAPLDALPNALVVALPTTYEAALQELETLVTHVDSGQLPLDQLLSSYQRGAQLLAFCKAKLEAVETQVRVLEGKNLKPWP